MVRLKEEEAKGKKAWAAGFGLFLAKRKGRSTEMAERGEVERGEGRWRGEWPRKKKIESQGRCGCSFVLPSLGAAGWFERDGFLGLGFFVFPSNVQNCPLYVLETPIYRQKYC